MRRATEATHSGASTSSLMPGRFSRKRASSGWAIRASPIQLGATTKMPDTGPSVSFNWRPFVNVERAAVWTARLAFAGDVEKHARMARPERRARQRAVQRQLLLGDLDFLGRVGAHFAFPFTGVRIGRASCRERVLIVVVAVACK